ncbi:hypothetical protein PF008_g18481 [Phytophthora fragariae]|uniref:Ubiquitin-like domain-containing protein n=1 Tax=Phytophthora fragariae TaxID=53985 RepID=A0A6G0R579_9STRA|nr:hypothetical protein PF008_g18481 [Phytophthora fragariae]
MESAADASAAASPRAASIYTPPDSPASGAMSTSTSPATPPRPTQSPGPAVAAADGSNNDDASLHLRLKLLDERVFDVVAAPSMSVADFRARVAQVTEVPAARQRLIYRGKLLKDGAALAAYDLKDGHTVHLVAKPAAQPATNSASSSNSMTQTAAAGQEEGEDGARVRAPRRRQQQPGHELDGPAWNLASLRSALRRNAATGAAAQHTQPLPMLREILDEMSESPQEAAEAMGLGTSGPRRTEAATTTVDLEPITQGILTMRTVLSTAAVEQDARAAAEEDERVEAEETHDQTQQDQPVRRGPRQFFVGQWLDVKDTVNQWLESTVMDIADGKVLVHYHGWPTRWDEWIDFDSDRIAAFRTRTLHTQNMQRMSPVPTTRVPSAPRVGDNDIRRMVVDVRNLMREMAPHIDRLAELCEEDLRREREQRQTPLNPVDDAESAGATEPIVPTSAAAAGESRESEVSEVAHLVAPLFDRFGRLLVDSARYFDPLLRPELRGTSQRQQERRSAALRYGHGGSAQRQAASASAPMEAQDNSLSIRDLITTSPAAASDANQPRRSIDVHIHAIVAPASFASLARGNGDADNSSDAGVSTRSVQTPSTPPIGRSFGFNDSRSAATTDDDGDHSRVPLLSSYRHRSHSQESGPTQQERAVARDLDNFLSDDFFGTSFGRDDEDDSDDDSSTDSDVQRMVQTSYRPPSPSGRISSPRTPQSQGSSVYSIGVIPEVAEAEERLRARAAEQESRQFNGSDHNGGSERASSASAGSSASSSSSGFPTFLEVMRRTLSGVRNLVHHDTSSSPAPEASHPVDLVSGFSLPSSSSSSSLSSSSLSPPASPAAHSSDESVMSRPRSPSSASSVEEDLDLDEVD